MNPKLARSLFYFFVTFLIFSLSVLFDFFKFQTCENLLKINENIIVAKEHIFPQDLVGTNLSFSASDLSFKGVSEVESRGVEKTQNVENIYYKFANVNQDKNLKLSLDLENSNPFVYAKKSGQNLDFILPKISFELLDKNKKFIKNIDLENIVVLSIKNINKTEFEIEKYNNFYHSIDFEKLAKELGGEIEKTAILVLQNNILEAKDEQKDEQVDVFLKIKKEVTDLPNNLLDAKNCVFDISAIQKKQFDQEVCLQNLVLDYKTDPNFEYSLSHEFFLKGNLDYENLYFALSLSADKNFVNSQEFFNKIDGKNTINKTYFYNFIFNPAKNFDFIQNYFYYNFVGDYKQKFIVKSSKIDKYLNTKHFTLILENEENKSSNFKSLEFKNKSKNESFLRINQASGIFLLKNYGENVFLAKSRESEGQIGFDLQNGGVDIEKQTKLKNDGLITFLGKEGIFVNGKFIENNNLKNDGKSASLEKYKNKQNFYVLDIKYLCQASQSCIKNTDNNYTVDLILQRDFTFSKITKILFFITVFSLIFPFLAYKNKTFFNKNLQ